MFAWKKLMKLNRFHVNTAINCLFKFMKWENILMVKKLRSKIWNSNKRIILLTQKLIRKKWRHYQLERQYLKSFLQIQLYEFEIFHLQIDFSPLYQVIYLILYNRALRQSLNQILLIQLHQYQLVFFFLWINEANADTHHKLLKLMLMGY
mgnify:CR=1 FL=1